MANLREGEEIIQVCFYEFCDGRVALGIVERPDDKEGYPIEDKNFADRFKYDGDPCWKKTLKIKVVGEVD